MGLSFGLGLPPAPKKGGDPTLLWDEDFVNGVYRYNRVRYPAVTDLPLTTFSRPSGGYGVNSAGLLVWFAAGVPRATDAGLTVEAGATNLLLRSQEFDNAAWAKSAGGTGVAPVVTANSALAPDGSMTADQVVFDRGASNTTSDTSILGTAASFPTTVASTYAASVWLKAISPVSIIMRHVASGTYSTLNLTTSWQRFSVSEVAAATSSDIQLGLRGTFGGAAPAATVFIWGAQLELGSIATSYIPTTTAAATRNADVLVSADTVIAPTIVAEFTVPLASYPYSSVWCYNDGTQNSKVMLQYNRSAGRMEIQVDTGGVNQAYIALGSVTPGSTYKVAVRLAPNDVAASLGGAAVATDTSVSLPTVTEFARGNGADGAGVWGAGIRRIRRYSVAKTNAELQALSA